MKDEEDMRDEEDMKNYEDIKDDEDMKDDDNINDKKQILGRCRYKVSSLWKEGGVHQQTIQSSPPGQQLSLLPPQES